MDKELIIDAKDSEVVIAILENNKLVELHKEKPDQNFMVGDLYLGRVKKIVAGLNAAFVDVGYEKDGFLHYLDLGHQARSLQKFVSLTISGKDVSPLLKNLPMEEDIDKEGKMPNVLKEGQSIMVQVAKEPISTKGPRLTCEISIAGRYLVLVPFSDRISVSQKIKTKEERDRLKRLIQSIRPENFGVIIRTVAEDKKVAELDSDLRELVQKWKSAVQGLKNSKPPKKVLGELDRTTAIIRDMFSPDFTKIIANKLSLVEDARSYVKTIAPEKEGILRHYTSKEDLFEVYGIEKQIKSSFGKHVTMESGAYLVIEHTEALHVIDVNSGNTAKNEKNQEENALRVNLEAAYEIARQLRLRDMGGIIVIDFIDMQLSDNKKMLFNTINEAMKHDKARHTVLPPSKFGLVQITRQRVRPETDIKTTEKCPSCNGTGEVQASILVIDDIQNTLRYHIEHKHNVAVLKVHPYVHAYLTKGFPSIQMKWFQRFRKWVKISPADALPLMQFKFLDANHDPVEY